MRKMFTISIGIAYLLLSPLLSIAHAPTSVNLLDFEAKASGAHVVVSWTTKSEVNCDYYLIQKSKDQLEWIEVATLDGAGNSNDVVNYSYIDKEAFPADSYYRLIQFNENGDFYVLSTNETSLMSLEDLEFYPNPASNELLVEANRDISDVQIKIMDLAGNPVSLEIEKLGNRTKINTSLLKNGIYILRTEFGQSVSSKRIVISHNR